MAVNAGEVSVALTLDSAGFASGLEAARASLASFAQELAALETPPEATAPEANSPTPDVSAQYAAAGASAGAAFGTSLSAAIAAGAASSSAAASGVAASTAQALSAAGANATPAGMQFSQSYAMGIASGAGAASSATAGLASSAAAAARGGMGGAQAAGRSFAAGLASGISSGRSAVISAAISVAQAAAAAARSALAIHSPSKVTERFGEYFDAGFIRGVENLSPDIRKSIGAALQVEPPAGAGYDGSREIAPTARVASAPIDYDRLADAMDRRQMVLTMDNRRLAQIQERETARAQTARNRSVALGYGK